MGMVMLHFGTYYYVHSMVLWEETYTVRNVSAASNSTVNFSFGVRPDDISFGSLQDPLSEYIGYQPVDISTLDAVAAFFPMLFGLLSFAMDDLTCWTKVLLCNSLLALGKGVFGWITVVPDSAGWARCRER